MIIWAPVFHFYQPPTQFPDVLKRICHESYRPLIEVLGEFTRARASVNITGSLTQMLIDCGHLDVVDGLRRLAEEGRIEFLGSAMYHPILPLIPFAEIVRQIELNRAANRRAFGDVYAPVGFFPPELAYDAPVAEAAERTGHRWVLASGIACNEPWPLDVVHRVNSHPGVAVFFRDDIISNRISFKNIDGFHFIDDLRSRTSLTAAYVVTAMDAETFGHHVADWERLFLAHVYAQFDDEPGSQPLEMPSGVDLAARHRQILETTAPRPGELRVGTVTDLLDSFPAGRPTTPRASSWSTSGQDLARGVPYPLWDDPANRVHTLLWRHLRIGLELVDLASRTSAPEGRAFMDIARGLLDRALHSCQFWWASRRPMWDLNMIERGVAEQRAVIINAMKAVAMSGAEGPRLEAEDRFAIAENLCCRIRQQLLTS